MSVRPRAVALVARRARVRRACLIDMMSASLGIRIVLVFALWRKEREDEGARRASGASETKREMQERKEEVKGYD